MAFKDIFAPKWKHSDSSVRFSAVREIFDQSILCQIISRDNDNDVLLAALKNITDNSMLENIAISHSSESLRIAAIEKIDNQAVLISICTQIIDGQIGMVAFRKINDGLAFVEIATTSQNEALKQSALQKINNIEHINRVIAECSDEKTKLSAQKKLDRYNQETKPYFCKINFHSNCSYCKVPLSVKAIAANSLVCGNCKKSFRHSSSYWKKKIDKAPNEPTPKCFICEESMSLPEVINDIASYKCVCNASYSLLPAANWLSDYKLNQYGMTIDTIFILDSSKKISGPSSRDVHEIFQCKECGAAMQIKNRSAHLHTCEFCSTPQYINLKKLNNSKDYNKQKQIQNWIVRVALKL